MAPPKKQAIPQPVVNYSAFATTPPGAAMLLQSAGQGDIMVGNNSDGKPVMKISSDGEFYRLVEFAPDYNKVLCFDAIEIDGEIHYVWDAICNLPGVVGNGRYLTCPDGLLECINLYRDKCKGYAGLSLAEFLCKMWRGPCSSEAHGGHPG